MYQATKPLLRLGILGSTRGTNLLPILTAIKSGALSAEIAIVISNHATAGILEKAKNAEIPNVFVDPTGLSRVAYDEKIRAIFLEYGVNFILLIGYLRILSPQFVQAFSKRILNVHPSLLPDFAGLMNEEVHAAVLAAGVAETGCTVHQVTEDVDAGPIVNQKRCAVLSNDTVASLKMRVQALEGQALLEALQKVGGC